MVLSDVGVAAYDGAAEIFDMSGLGDNAPVRLLSQSSGYDAAGVDRLAKAKHAPIAILQICWEVVAQRLPRDWRLIGFWYEPRNVVFGSHDVGFYAIEPGADERLKSALQAFQVPPSIEVVYPSARPYDEAFKDLVRKGCPASENLDGVL